MLLPSFPHLTCDLQVLDYDNVQQTLLPLLARAYSLVFMVSRAGGRRGGEGGLLVCLNCPVTCHMSSSHLHCAWGACRCPAATFAPANPSVSCLPAHPPALPARPPARLPALQGRSMMGMYDDFDAARARGDFATLPELHALSSGLKALSTDITAAGIETCRRQCGGHGYMAASGLPTLFASYVQNCTWEGDNSGEPGRGARGRQSLLQRTAVLLGACSMRWTLTCWPSNALPNPAPSLSHPPAYTECSDVPADRSLPGQECAGGAGGQGAQRQRGIPGRRGAAGTDTRGSRLRRSRCRDWQAGRQISGLTICLL